MTTVSFDLAMGWIGFSLRMSVGARYTRSKSVFIMLGVGLFFFPGIIDAVDTMGLFIFGLGSTRRLVLSPPPVFENKYLLR